MSSELQVILEPGIAQKLQFAINRTRGTYEDVEYLSTGENFRAVSLLRTGKAKLVEVTETGSVGAVIPIAPTPTAWTVDDEGNIHFTVTSNGFTREQWEEHLARRGCRIRDWARQVLHHVNEVPTNGVAYHVVVRPGSKIASHARVTKEIREHATDKGWRTPHWEVACLISDTFTNEQLEQMGPGYIVTMHEPIESEGYPDLLISGRSGGGRWLGMNDARPDGKWDNRSGFAFVVPQELVLKPK